MTIARPNRRRIRRLIQITCPSGNGRTMTVAIRAYVQSAPRPEVK